MRLASFGSILLYLTKGKGWFLDILCLHFFLFLRFPFFWFFSLSFRFIFSCTTF